ncbi:MAG: hypothetical protein KGL39_18080 [Patescibacteria group bacterium]|nr:hypothetical protein [Patescibacteria group bacterium]
MEIDSRMLCRNSMMDIVDVLEEKRGKVYVVSVRKLLKHIKFADADIDAAFEFNIENGFLSVTLDKNKPAQLKSIRWCF